MFVRSRMVKLWFVGCVCAVMPALANAAPAIFYSDLAAGPHTGGESNAGVWVTISGRGFGSTQGSGVVTTGQGEAASYKSWNDSKIVFQIGANATSGNIVVRDDSGAVSNGVSFTVRAGRIREATTSTANSVINSAQSGDVIYFRAGNYTGRYGVTTWGAEQITLGSWAQDVAFVAYPGEVVNVRDWRLGDGQGTAHRVTIANFVMVGNQSCIHSDGWHENDESGAQAVRLVGNDCRCTYNNNTMTGMFRMGADGWRVFGNTLRDTGTSPPINNNHGVYIQTGADDVEVAWNRFERLRVGHVVQVHTDGTPRLHENVRIHDNEFTGANPGDMRGIVSGNIADASTIYIYNNILRNLGQNVSAIMVTGGTVTVEHNTFDRIESEFGALRVAWSTGPRPVARNNIINPLPGSIAFGGTDGANVSQWQQSGNQTNVPLTNDRPTTLPLTGVQATFLVDHDGRQRPNPPTVGAYEGAPIHTALPSAPTGLRAD